MCRDDAIRCRHMLDAAREAVAFGSGRCRGDLSTDRQLALSLIKSLEIIGEAANHVSQAYRERHPQIPWLDIVGMRHRLIHAYHDINLDTVWRTVVEDLPPLVGALQKMVE